MCVCIYMNRYMNNLYREGGGGKRCGCLCVKRERETEIEKHTHTHTHTQIHEPQWALNDGGALRCRELPYAVARPANPANRKREEERRAEALR